MPDEQLIKWLIEEGVDSWNSARDQDLVSYPNALDSTTLDGAIFPPDFSNANFWWAFRTYGKPETNWPISLAGINLVEADLSHSMLRLVDLSGAELFGADLSKANLNETNLSGAHLQYADLQGARLEKANLTESDLQGALLNDADLQNAILTKANLSTANLIGADLSGTNLWDAILFHPNTQSPIQGQFHVECMKSLNDLLNISRRLKKHFDGYHEEIVFYFRGEQSDEWDLRPSVKRGKFATFESNMLPQLMSRRPEEFSALNSSLAQWVLAQHHGLKTRFLDITKNPLVALFHACEESTKYKCKNARLHIFAVPAFTC